MDRDRHDPVIKSKLIDEMYAAEAVRHGGIPLLRPAQTIDTRPAPLFVEQARQIVHDFAELEVTPYGSEAAKVARAKTLLPTDAQARKDTPVVTGVLDYFPLAIAYVAHVSKVGNDQHNPGQPLHWAKGKSTDHADSLVRHLIERGKPDSDGVLHSGKVAWRALALLQTELENA